MNGRPDRLEVWALWSIGGRELLACTDRSEAVIEALPDDAWIELDRVAVVTIQIGMTPRGPAVLPMTLPYASTSDDRPRLRVRVRAIDSIWWFSTMPDRTRRELEKRSAEAAQAATSLAASAAGIVTR